MSKLRFSIIVFLAFMGCAHQSTHRNPAQDSSPLVCNINDFGAKGNGQNDTTAIQAAVDACGGKNGVVVVPAGAYASGTIRLHSHMTFQLAAGATLNGIRDKSAYPFLNPPTTNRQLLNCRRALLYAEATDGLTIEGPGIVDGNGDFDKWDHIDFDENGVFLPPDKIFKEAQRPMALFSVQGKNLVIQNLQVKHAAMWAVVLMESSGAQVSQLNIDSQIGVAGGTRDGLDIVDGNNIRVDHATISSEDDSICLKSGLPSGLQNVSVTNSHVAGSLVANGLKFGTASVGILQNINFENILVEHVAQAAMAVESVDGSQISGVTFKGITYNDTGSGIFVLLGWRGNQTQPKCGSIANITFQNIRGTSQKQPWGSAISGSSSCGSQIPSNIIFQNVQMTFKGNDSFTAGHLPSAPAEYQGQYPDPQMWPDLPSEGLYFRHVHQITLNNTKLIRLPGVDARPILVPDTHKGVFDAP